MRKVYEVKIRSAWSPGASRDLDTLHIISGSVAIAAVKGAREIRSQKPTPVNVRVVSVIELGDAVGA